MRDPLKSAERAGVSVIYTRREYVKEGRSCCGFMKTEETIDGVPVYEHLPTCPAKSEGLMIEAALEVERAREAIARALEDLEAAKAAVKAARAEETIARREYREARGDHRLRVAKWARNKKFVARPWMVEG